MVCAVAELAMSSQLQNVGKSRKISSFGLGKRKFPHSRGVDQTESLFCEKQLAVGGRVSAAAVVAPLFGDFLCRVSQKAIDDAGFADAR